MTRNHRFTPHSQRGFSDFGRKQAPVEIACAIVRDNDRDNAILITDGSVEEHVDPETGEITERLKQSWIPRSQISHIEPGRDGKSATVTMSEWIAKKVGLI